MFSLREKLEETFWQSNYSDEVSLLLFLSHCEHRRNTYKCVLWTEDRRFALRDRLESK